MVERGKTDEWLSIHVSFMMSQVKIIEMLFVGTFLMDQMKSSWEMEIIQWTTAAHFSGTQGV